jgi:hypothetical protein
VIDWEHDPDQNDPRPPEGESYLRPEVAPEIVYHFERTIASFGNKGGYSPILCAQTIPETVTVGEATISGDTADVLVSTSFGTKFTVALVMWDGKWRMCDIGCRLE